jgi:hypothetical protein
MTRSDEEVTINRAATLAACVAWESWPPSPWERFPRPTLPAGLAIPAFLPSPLDASSGSGGGAVAGAGGGSSKSYAPFNAPAAALPTKPSPPIGHRAPGPRVTHNWAREQAINPVGPAPSDKTKHSPTGPRPSRPPRPLPTPATARARRRPAGPARRPRRNRRRASPWALPGIRGVSSSPAVPGLATPTRGRRQLPGGTTAPPRSERNGGGLRRRDAGCA